jgi:hypothetical protein
MTLKNIKDFSISSGKKYSNKNSVVGLSPSYPVKNVQELFDAGLPSGNYWLTDGVDIFENYVLMSEGYAWARILRLNSNHQLISGTRNRDQWMHLGGSYNDGTVNAFSSTKRLTGEEEGYWGHNPLYKFANNAGNLSFFIKAAGRNAGNPSNGATFVGAGSIVNKNYRLNNYGYSSTDPAANSNWDAIPGLLDVNTGIPISGSLASFADITDNSRGGWGSTGTSLSVGNHSGIGIREGGPSGAEAGDNNSATIQFWHYSGYTYYVNITFGNNNHPINYSYSGLTDNVDFNLYIRTQV